MSNNPVAKVDDIADGGVIRCPFGDIEVAIFRKGDEFHAINASCPHRRGPLDEANLEDGYIAVCPWHGWRFDIRTGKSPTHPGQVECFRVTVRDGALYLEHT